MLAFHASGVVPVAQHSLKNANSMERCSKGRCFKSSFGHMSIPAALLFLSLFRHVSKSSIVRCEARDTSVPHFAMVMRSCIDIPSVGVTSLVCSWYGGEDARCAGTDCALSFLCEWLPPVPSGCWNVPA